MTGTIQQFLELAPLDFSLFLILCLLFSVVINRRMPNKTRRFLEWVPLDYAGLIVASAALILNQIDFTVNGRNLPLYLAIFLLFCLIILFIGRWRVPSISTYVDKPDDDNRIPLSEFGTIQIEQGGTSIDLFFDVPDHHDEVYLYFDIDGYDVGVDQPHHIKYDGDRAVTDYSTVENFELTLSLTPNTTMTNQSATKPLEIVDKLHNRTVCEVPVKG